MTVLSYPPLAVASSSTNILLAAGSSIQAYNPVTSKLVSSPEADAKTHGSALIRLIDVSEDGKVAVTVGDDKSLKVWDVTEDEIKLRSTRMLVKKGSHVTFAPDGSIVVCDKVGDAYSYPLDPVPADPSASRPPMFALVSDPSKNPDCTYLLGHTSVLNNHVVTPDSKWIITADRDEHIRVSRYPKSYVVDKYLFGHDGFVSALHIPSSHPTTLISGGGDSSLRIWDYPSGSLLSKVDIYPSVLPHRKVRASMRKIRAFGRKGKEETPTIPEEGEAGAGSGQGSDQQADADANSAADGEETFYSAPDGWMLPSGQGVLVRKIDSVKVGDDVVVLFFSEGASAIHSFVLSPDATKPSPVQTISLPYPVLDFTPIPTQPGQVLVTLDSAWGTLKKNPSPGVEARQDVIARTELDEAEREALKNLFAVVHIGASGSLSQESAEPFAAITSSLPTADIKTISSLNMYQLLNMLPRWPGTDEEVEDAPIAADGASVAPSSTLTAGGSRKVYTPEELAAMGTKRLGRLKATGVNVGSLLVQRQKKAKEENKKKLAAQAQAVPPAPKKQRQERAKPQELSEEDMANA